MPDSKSKNRTDNATVGSQDYFPTQQHGPSAARTTITDDDRRYGAPFGPIPASFLRLPEEMSVCVASAREEEIAFAWAVRRPFFIEGSGEPYLRDVVRAFRLLGGLRSYLEIGTFDRGNLAYVSGLLADDAILIGVDTQPEDQRDTLLRSVLKPGQRYFSVIGDSRSSDIVQRVRAILDSQGISALDAVFIDGNHTAHAVLCDYVNYGSMVSDGIVMFHDSLWEGDVTHKGAADALAEIDKLDPIYLVPGEGSCHRFMRPMWRDTIWGVFGIHFNRPQPLPG